MKQIYLDSDDEITAIISKLESLPNETVALIPPKRSAALQSVVNLKLLKKTTDSVKTKLVLITRDPAILNIASQLKILTASNLEADPAVPEPKISNRDIPSDTIDGAEPSENDFKSADSAASKVKKGDKKSKVAKSKKVPDFDRFKKKILIAIGIVLLLALSVWAVLNLFPNAAVSIQGRTQDVSTIFDMRLDREAQEPDFEDAVLPAVEEQLNRTLTTSFEATGEKTVGEKATGQVTVTNNCYETASSTNVSAGTAFTAANGRVFRNDSSVNIPPASISQGSCNPSTVNVPVTADEIGPDYNIGPTSYTVGNFPSGSGGISGSGGNMTGGTEEQVSVIAASDVRNAQESLLEDEREQIIADLRRQFEATFYIVEASLSENVSESSSEPAVGQEASQGRLVLQVSYSIHAVEQEDIEGLLDFQHTLDAEDTEGLAAIENGLEAMTVSATEEENVYEVAADGILGPDIDLDVLKEEIAGMSYGDAVSHIENKPNVIRAQIDLSPFWSSKIPSNQARIDIEFEVTTPYADDSGD